MSNAYEMRETKILDEEHAICTTDASVGDCDFGYIRN